MANEVQITAQLQVRSGSINYQGQPNAFAGNMATVNGPSPGAVTATPQGTTVAFPQLALPGYYRIQNLDTAGQPTTRFVEVGIWNGIDFFPLNELLAGETYVNRFSRNIGEEEVGTSSSTTHVGARQIMVKSHGAGNAGIKVLIEAFDN